MGGFWGFDAKTYQHIAFEIPNMNALIDCLWYPGIDFCRHG